MTSDNIHRDNIWRLLGNGFGCKFITQITARNSKSWSHLFTDPTGQMLTDRHTICRIVQKRLPKQYLTENMLCFNFYDILRGSDPSPKKKSLRIFSSWFINFIILIFCQPNIITGSSAELEFLQEVYLVICPWCSLLHKIHFCKLIWSVDAALLCIYFVKCRAYQKIQIEHLTSLFMPCSKSFMEQLVS